MIQDSKAESVLALSWEAGGVSLGYAWHKIDDVTIDDSSVQSRNFPWNSALQTQSTGGNQPCIYVGNIHGKQNSDTNLLYQLRLTTEPTLYLVAQKTKLPPVLTKSESHTDSSPSVSTNRSDATHLRRPFHVAYTHSKPTVNSPMTETGEPHLPVPKVKYMHPVELSADTARENLGTILSASYEGECFHTMYDQSREQQLSCHIDTRSNAMMCALGGLLSYLQRTYPSLFGQHYQPQHVPTFRVLPLQIESQVLLDEATYRELEIFKREPHPASHQLIGSSKEGLSLFGIVSHFCRTTKGSDALRDMFINPTNNVQTLQNRLTKIRYLLDNQEFTAKLRKLIRGVDHPIALFQRLRKGTHTPADWHQMVAISKNYTVLLTMLHESTALCDLPACFAACADVGEPCTPVNEPCLPKRVQHYCSTLEALETKINVVLDIPECTAGNRFVIRKGYDAQLDRLRVLRDTMPKFLTTVGQKELEKLPTEIAFALSLSVVYFPQFGYHIALPSATTEEKMIETLTNEHKWESAFSNEESTFFKNHCMRELDMQLGDVHASVQDIQAGILRDLEQWVLQNTTLLYLFSLNGLFHHVSRFDAFCALAHAANEYGWKPPAYHSEPIIRIQNGRHPLLPCNAWRPSVGNDTCFRSVGGPSVSIVTGANGSGKSIYLKQVALLSYLAHIGSFVPAEEMAIGPISAICTCIGSPIHRSFASDITRVGRMLRFPVKSASQRPLLCIDEFGKGTLAQDGIALLTALVSDFLTREPNGMPFVAMTTHYTEIFRNIKTTVKPDIIETYLEVSVMAVHVDRSCNAAMQDEQDAAAASVQILPKNVLHERSLAAQESQTRVKYTYRKTPGINTKTYALPLASLCGIPSDVVQHAECVLRGLLNDKSLANIIDEEKVISEIENAYAMHANEEKRLRLKYAHWSEDQLSKYMLQRNLPLLKEIREVYADGDSENN